MARRTERIRPFVAAGGRVLQLRRADAQARNRQCVAAACAHRAALSRPPPGAASEPGGAARRSRRRWRRARRRPAPTSWISRDGHVVFDDRGDSELLSASVTKLYTTATALMELGPRARLSTRVLGTGRRDGATWTGDLYLRGGGDFTFGTAAFARQAYGSGASVERLAATLRRSGLRRIRGRVFGDASLFTDNGGTPFGLVLCPDPLFGRDCPYGPGRQAGAADPERPAYADRLRPRAFGTPRVRRRRAGRPGSRRARLTRALRDAGISVDGHPGAASGRRRGPARSRRRDPRRSRGSPS